MSIDLSQFIQAFLDESFEGLNLMESELLGEDALDVDRINAIFRAAHSIKGSAGTFGFSAVGEFTHGVETLLDQIRGGERTLDEPVRALLLEAVDRIRDMLVAARDGTAHDSERAEQTRRAIEERLATPSSGSPGEFGEFGEERGAQGEGAEPSCAERRWQIAFRPHTGLLATANDPLRIFEYLRELGALTVSCDTSRLPAVADFDPESCHLDWTLELVGDVSEAQIREAFEWVEDQCDLEVTSLFEDPALVSAPAAEAPEECIAPPARAVGTGDGDVAAAPIDRPAVEEPALAQPANAHPSSARRGTEAPGDDSGTPEPMLAPEDPIESSPASAAEPVNRRAQSDRRAQVDRRAEASSIRVPVDKVDTLVDLVGELIISQAMLTTISEELEERHGAAGFERLHAGLAQLERNTRELQEAVLSVRMLPISFAFSRFPRLVRDLSTSLGKKVELSIEGEETELDKGVIEKLVDPLTHIVRNAIDHGIERPETRVAAGKPEHGSLRLTARHQGGNIVIQIMDDGAGLDRERILRTAEKRGIAVPEAASDREVWELIFHPGFSTAEKITDLSGRGVGMDVVRQNVESINGRLDINSLPGAGTHITIRLPLTLAILDGMSVRVGEEIFIVPLTAILESLQPASDQLHSISGRGRVVRLRGDYLPLVSLSEVFNLPARHSRAEDGILVVVESAKDRAALFVDELVAQHQVVIKSLESNYRKVPGVSGATIMGDGRVALILDVDMLTQVHGQANGQLH